MKTKTDGADPVVLPKHYARFPIEPVRFCMENGLDPFQFNIIKYTCRHSAKNGIEDLKKAKRYIEMYIDFLEGDPNWWMAPDDPNRLILDEYVEVSNEQA